MVLCKYQYDDHEMLHLTCIRIKVKKKNNKKKELASWMLLARFVVSFAQYQKYHIQLVAQGIV